MPGPRLDSKRGRSGGKKDASRGIALPKIRVRYPCRGRSDRSVILIEHLESDESVNPTALLRFVAQLEEIFHATGGAVPAVKGHLKLRRMAAACHWRDRQSRVDRQGWSWCGIGWPGCRGRRKDAGDRACLAWRWPGSAGWAWRASANQGRHQSCLKSEQLTAQH